MDCLHKNQSKVLIVRTVVIFSVVMFCTIMINVHICFLKKKNQTPKNSFLFPYVMLICFSLVSFHLRDFLPLHSLLFRSTSHDTSSSDTDINQQRRKSGSRPSKDKNSDGVGVSATEKRFAYSLLEKLLGYFDNASSNLMETRPSSRFSRRGSYSTASEDVKFFAKVKSLLCYVIYYIQYCTVL